MGAEEQMEFSQGQDCIGKEWFDGAGRLASQRAGIVRRRALGAGLGAQTIVEKGCGALNQETVLISARSVGPSLRVKKSGNPADSGQIDHP
jgi:hypothetical protein